MMVDNLHFSNNSQPISSDDRNFGQFSDHVTVWIDKYIGKQEGYESFKAKFNDNIQVLQSNNLVENEIDDESMLCENSAVLRTLCDQVYCLKYFSTIQEGLDYMNNHPEKKIFFISSGTIGKDIVPQIANLSQIQGIYIFCGNISHHTEWAGDYDDKISAMLEHQDNLLERLTRDIALYVEKKGDEHKEEGEILKARNCYSWAHKLLVRGRALGDSGTGKLIDRVTKKNNELQCSSQAPSTD